MDRKNARVSQKNDRKGRWSADRGDRYIKAVSTFAIDVDQSRVKIDTRNG